MKGPTYRRIFNHKMVCCMSLGNSHGCDGSAHHKFTPLGDLVGPQLWRVCIFDRGAMKWVPQAANITHTPTFGVLDPFLASVYFGWSRDFRSFWAECVKTWPNWLKIRLIICQNRLPPTRNSSLERFFWRKTTAPPHVPYRSEKPFT